MKKLMLSIVLASVTSCGGIGGGGGGGGDSDPHYAGDVNFMIEKSSLDSGDIDRVNIEVSNLNQGGAILKIRLPLSLRLVKNSTILFPQQEAARRIQPSVETSTSEERYLVFFLRPEEAIDNTYVSLQIDLKALEGDPEAFIEIDLDNNDPSVSDGSEFKAKDPRFTALQREDIYIAPDASQTDPTPVPSTTGTPTAAPTGTATPTK